MAQFIAETRIAAAPSAVFAFHESPNALERLTPPWERVKVVSHPGSLQPGSRAVLRMWIGPIATTWIAEHTEYDPPHLFADRMVSGPFSSWHHAHRFLDDGAGGTILRDVVDFQPPLGFIGRWLAEPFIKQKLAKMFSYRHEVTRRIVESGDF